MAINKKIIYIAAAIVLIAITGFFILRSVFSGGSGQRGGEELSEPAAYKISPLVNISQGDVLSIGTPRGAVGVRNFYKTALGAEEQFVILKKNENYGINYDTYTSGFSIYIYISAAPLEANRLAAEKDFLDILDIDMIEACKLNIWEGVSPDADKNLSGVNMGLSFCGAIPNSR